MTRNARRFSGRALLTAILGASVLSGCAATTYDESIASSTTDLAVAVSVPTGTTEDLLRTLATEMTGLSEYIGPDRTGRTPDGKTERITLIESLWDAARTEVTATDAEAADAIGRMVALARTAVERNRPADADKAARFAGQVIDQLLAPS